MKKEENTAKMEGDLYMSCLCGKHKSDSKCPVYLKNNPMPINNDSLRECCEQCRMLADAPDGKETVCNDKNCYCHSWEYDFDMLFPPTQKESTHYSDIKGKEDCKCFSCNATEKDVKDFIRKLLAHREAMRENRDNEIGEIVEKIIARENKRILRDK